MSIPLAERVLGAARGATAQPPPRASCSPVPPPPLPGSLEAEDDDLGGVAGPLTHGQVQVAVDLLILEEPHLPDLSNTLGSAGVTQP